MKLYIYFGEIERYSVYGPAAIDNGQLRASPESSLNCLWLRKETTTVGLVVSAKSLRLSRFDGFN